MAIKHAPKFYVRLCNEHVIYPQNFTVFPGAIYGRFCAKNGNVLWVCDNYSMIDGKIPVHFFFNEKWKLCFVGENHPCYQWVKSVIEKLGRVPEIRKEKLGREVCESLMKNNSLHKKGTGSRINTHQINQPLRWNEGTEIAHWHGKGNASVVASNIR